MKFKLGDYRLNEDIYQRLGDALYHVNQVKLN